MDLKKRPREWVQTIQQQPDYWFHVNRFTADDSLSVRWGCVDMVMPHDPILNSGFDFTVLKFVIRGRGKYVTATQTIDIEPNMVIWALPHEETKLYSTEEGNNLLCYVLTIWGKETDDLVMHYLRSRAGAAVVDHADHVESLFEEVTLEAKASYLNQKENCNLLAKVLMHRIGSNVQLKTKSTTSAREAFKRCEGYIEGNFAEIKMIGEVAEACEISSQQLNRLFDRFGTMSPYEYLTKLRMGAAAELLYETHDPIQHIAHRVGYTDPGLFSRNFKAYYDMNPSQYRSTRRAK